MRSLGSHLIFLLILSLPFLLSSCATYRSDDYDGRYAENNAPRFSDDYGTRLPQQIASSEKTVVVDPRVHAWGAYDNGQLVKAGIASAGSGWCRDLGRPCRTRVGSFRIYSLGSPTCKSHIFPLHRGGAPMPYCMYFNNGQALHGVPDDEVGEGNYSHGCVRMRVVDAEWLRYNFANVGTKVVVKPYD